MRRLAWLLAPALAGVCAAPAWGADGAREASGRPQLNIGGFTDFDFRSTDTQASGATSGFNNGQFVLHLTSTLSDRFSFFGEISMSAHDDHYSSEIERSIIKFRADDHLGVSLGRFHTPINWWNTAFHHGQWLQTTVGRPEMTRFGGSFIPVHFVGAVAQGVVPMLDAAFNYDPGLGNGRADTLSRAGDAGDATNNRAVFGAIAVRPNALYPLEVGGGIYRDLAHRPTGRSFDENIAAAHLVWPSETPEVLAEVAYVRHEDRESGAAYGSQGHYVQLAYRLPWAGALFKPYVREERLRIDGADPVFAAIPSVSVYIAGVRYDASAFVALKAEFKRMDFDTRDDVDALQLQISCTF